MHIAAIATRPLLPPEDDLCEVIADSLSALPPQSVIAVSSKVVAIGQGRCIKMPEDAEEKQALKERLIREEADRYLLKDETYPFSRTFTVVEGIFGSSSGIDESNGNGWFVLLPRDADGEAARIRNFCMKRYGVTDLGVVIIDSRTALMRNGVIGVALGHAGFKALHDYRGEADIFGRRLRYERTNIADCLATTATLMVGEGSEQTPIALITEIPRIEFVPKDDPDDPLLIKAVPMERDVFAQFFMHMPWKQHE